MYLHVAVVFDIYAIFLRVLYSILNAPVILARNATLLERNEERLARNETGGGNLLLSGSVCVVFVICRTRNLCLLICGIQRNTENFWSSKDLKDKRLRIFRYVGDIFSPTSRNSG